MPPPRRRQTRAPARLPDYARAGTRDIKHSRVPNGGVGTHKEIVHDGEPGDADSNG